MDNNERIDFIWSLVNQIIPNKELQTIEVKEFTDECVKMIELYAKKNHDYGNSFEQGMNTIGPAYGIGRLYDKMNRIITLMKVKAEITDESIEDTIRDLACYSVMTSAYLTLAKNSIATMSNKKADDVDFEG